MSGNKSLEQAGFFPIMVGGCLHGHQGEYETRPDGGLPSMKEAKVVKDACTDDKQPVMIGEFQDGQGDRWFMLVNLDMRRKAKIRLQLQKGHTGVEHVSLGTGRLIAADAAQPVAIPPGSGYLYKALK